MIEVGQRYKYNNSDIIIKIEECRPYPSHGDLWYFSYEGLYSFLGFSTRYVHQLEQDINNGKLILLEDKEIVEENTIQEKYNRLSTVE